MVVLITDDGIVFEAGYFNGVTSVSHKLSFEFYPDFWNQVGDSGIFQQLAPYLCIGYTTDARVKTERGAYE